MHVGWAAMFAPPRTARARLRDPVAHIAAGSAARRASASYRVDALGLKPVWIDVEDFDVDRARPPRRRRGPAELADAVLSVPLRRDRPLWEFWIADRARRRAHRRSSARPTTAWSTASRPSSSARSCSTPSRTRRPPTTTDWRRAAGPHALELLARGAGTARASSCSTAALPARASPARRSRCRPRQRTARALAGAARCRSVPPSALNEPISPDASLAAARARSTSCALSRARTGDHQRRVLAAVRGRAAPAAAQRGEERPPRSRRWSGQRPRRRGREFGNRISFMFVELPATARPSPAGLDRRRRRARKSRACPGRRRRCSSALSSRRDRCSPRPRRAREPARCSTSSSPTSPARGSRVHAGLPPRGGLSGRAAGRRHGCRSG